MIINENVYLEFAGMGLFSTTQNWIHPLRKESTYEIIYVIDGTVNIKEENIEYSLSKNNLLILKPNLIHMGFKESTNTTFFWLHFSTNDIDRLINSTFFVESFLEVSLFRKLMHIDNSPSCDQYSKDILTAQILIEIKNICFTKSTSSKLTNDILEWIRINTDAKLTVNKVSQHFGYNSEYLSRIMQKYHSVKIKQVIINNLIFKSKNLLCNTYYSTKEISALLNFSDANSFTKFFQYHEKISPTKFRNLYSNIHMNKS